MSDINKLLTEVKEDLDLFGTTRQENISSLLTTIESLQGELKAADDHEATLKHAYHVRQNINEKELYDKNKIIESQKEEIKSQFDVIVVNGKLINSQNEVIESLKAITELAVKGLKKVCYLAPTGTDSFDAADSTLSEIEKLQNV